MVTTAQSAAVKVNAKHFTTTSRSFKLMLEVDEHSLLIHQKGLNYKKRITSISYTIHIGTRLIYCFKLNRKKISHMYV